MARTNKATQRRIVESVNRGDHSIFDEVLSPHIVVHGFPMPPGIDAFKQIGRMFRTAFPDFHQEIDLQFSAGDRVVTRFTNHGTHRGDFLGIPATGRKVAWSGIQIDRFKDGKIIEMWTQFDQFGLMQQLGAIPAAPQS